MEATYYNPKAEELYLGFEFEAKKGSGLVPEGLYKEGEDWKLTTWNYFDYCTPSYNPEYFRVKYLSADCIESLGWVSPTKLRNPDWWEISAGDTKYWLSLNAFTEGRGYYLNIGGASDRFCFSGYVKNKSELKRLMVQLGITKEQ
jgi:hypothetical protein